MNIFGLSPDDMEIDDLHKMSEEEMWKYIASINEILKQGEADEEVFRFEREDGVEGCGEADSQTPW